MNKSEKNLNYTDYISTQIERSKAKWASTTFDEKLFYKTLLTALPKMAVTSTGKCLKPERICCMGIRNGNEYNSFKKIQKVLTEIEGAHIYGVDINPDVVKVGPNCFARDFTSTGDWQGKFDFIYSNSLDHSFDVEKTIDAWWDALKHDRFMLIQMSKSEKVCKTDIYNFQEDDCYKLFKPSKFEIRHIWQEHGQTDSFNLLVRIIK